MVAVELRIENREALLVHIASSFDKAIEWIKKHGEDWHEQEYFFATFSAEIDKDYDCFNCDDLRYIDKQGNIVQE